MFTLRLTQLAQEAFDQLKTAAEHAGKSRKSKAKTKSSKQEGLFKQIQKTLLLLRNDPKHPGLSTHEYDSIEHPFAKKQKVFEAYAQNNTPSAYRVFWCYGPGKREITIVAITPHP